jgi:hypothetical protein
LEDEALEWRGVGSVRGDAPTAAPILLQEPRRLAEVYRGTSEALHTEVQLLREQHDADRRTILTLEVRMAYLDDSMATLKGNVGRILASLAELDRRL